VRLVQEVRVSSERRCPQCWKFKPYPEAFIGRRGRPVSLCSACTAHYKGWESRTTEEKFAAKRRGVTAGRVLRASLIVDSKNRKLGGILASITSRNTCPPSCGLFEKGCYAEYHVLAHHWRRVTRFGKRWPAFLDEVRALSAGTLWRHNVAGDLPGEGDAIDPFAVDELVHANEGRRGFTFTHKPMLATPGRADFTDRAPLVAEVNSSTVRRANESGFTVNLSADSLEQADDLADLGIAPVAVVVATDAPIRLRTPKGRRVVLCPAETPAALTCATCQLCAIPTRKAIVGFRAHGQAKNLVSELVRPKRGAA